MSPVGCCSRRRQLVLGVWLWLLVSTKTTTTGFVVVVHQQRWHHHHHQRQQPRQQQLYQFEQHQYHHRQQQQQQFSLAAATTTKEERIDTAAVEDTVVGISIEYCTGCKWGLRSFWMAQELLSTFQQQPHLKQLTVSLIPNCQPPGGNFQIRLLQNNNHQKVLLWDRREPPENGFPTIPQLKQLVRDQLPQFFSLRHSDTPENKQKLQQQQPTGAKVVTKKPTATTSPPLGLWVDEALPCPQLTIRYCIGCQWLLRAAYYGQELLLTTFTSGELGSVSLQPSTHPGEFSIHLTTLSPPDNSSSSSSSSDNNNNNNNHNKHTTTLLLWDRSLQGNYTYGGFPEAKVLKQMVREYVAPNKDLGHSETTTAKQQQQPEESYY